MNRAYGRRPAAKAGRIQACSGRAGADYLVPGPALDTGRIPACAGMTGRVRP